MVYILVILGLAILYLGWYISLTSWSRLTELGVEHKRNSLLFFDTLLLSFLFGLLLARLVWMAMNMTVYADVPWGFLPYVRTALSIDWLTYFPWRILRFTEGINNLVLWTTTGLVASFTVYVPTISLARKLRVEKRSVMMGFVIRALLGMIATLGYFVLLILFAS
jgi:hypothetical protein